MRNISQLVATANGHRAFLVDTLALVRRLESQGLSAKQAEAITAVITEVLNDSLENVAQSFTSKTEMQRSEMMAEAALSKFKGEVQSSQEHHFATLQRETERLRTDIDKMRSELRYEIDKVTSGQRLDLNLERGRIREELATQSSETSNLTNKLDRVSLSFLCCSIFVSHSAAGSAPCIEYVVSLRVPALLTFKSYEFQFKPDGAKI
jgi:predicted RNase H-like nuclease (RuvC/YqgF family)